MASNISLFAFLHYLGNLQGGYYTTGLYSVPASVTVFEGNDAAGKGGAIRRVAAALDPRQYHIVPIAAPSEDERAQPYLWRFWQKIPARGMFTVFDRSWYGRVLVERIEGFCTPAAWMRGWCAAVISGLLPASGLRRGSRYTSEGSALGKIEHALTNARATGAITW